MSYFIPVDFVNATMGLNKNVCLTRIALVVGTAVLKGKIRSNQTRLKVFSPRAPIDVFFGLGNE